VSLIGADPPLVDLVDRHRIEVVQLLATAPNRDHQVRVFEQRKVLANRLASHGKACTKATERLTVFTVESVEENPARRVGESLKDLVHELTICSQMAACQAFVMGTLLSDSRAFLMYVPGREYIS